MVNAQKFRILSLSGGGARGIFQAAYLQLLEERRKSAGKLHEIFDLIVGTSTGAITAAAIAQGIPASTVTALFESHGPKIFMPRTKFHQLFKCFSYFAGGPMFSLNPLEAKLNQLLTGTFKDFPKLLVTASQINPYAHKLFGIKASADVTITDAVLSSCSAPAYFQSHRVERLGKSFIDGGLWANDPALAAYIYAKECDIDSENIRILSIGTGRMDKGVESDDYDSRSTVSQALRVIDLMFATQEKSSEYFLASMLKADQVMRVNASLTSAIALANASSAIKTLPGRAREVFDQNKEDVEKFLAE